MIWPSPHRWSGLDRPFRTHLSLVLVIFLVVAAAGFWRPGPTRTERMVLEWAQAHVDLGLAETKGYNLSKQWLTTTTPVRMGEHQVYVSAPPLYTLFFASVYAIGGRHWRALRLAPIALGLVYLYACLVLACTHFDGPARSWLMYLALSPMILIHSTGLEINVGTLGLALLAYLCFCNYLRLGASQWLIWAGAFYLAAFWSSYVAFSIVPPMIAQLLLHRGLSSQQRRAGLITWLGVVGIGLVAMLVHVGLLPGALEAMLGRASLRYSATLEDARTAISLPAFSIRLAVRMVTHYTPICVVLGGIGLGLALKRAFRHDVAGVTSPQPVSSWSALLQFATWGLPFGVLAINLSYIHPYFLYYFAVFFAFGSALALEWIDRRGAEPHRRLLVHSIVGLFLVLSLTRSLFALAGGSLPEVLSPFLPAFIMDSFSLSE